MPLRAALAVLVYVAWATKTANGSQVLLQSHADLPQRTTEERLPNRIVARFSLGGSEQYELPIHLKDVEDTSTKGFAQNAAIGAVAAIVCLVLMTIFCDVLQSIRKKYQHKERQRIAKGITVQRLVALASMRQAAELLLHSKIPLNQQQKQRFLEQAQDLEKKLLLLQDLLPDTAAAGNILIDRLLLASGAETVQQQQKRSQQRQKELEERRKQEEQGPLGASRHETRFGRKGRVAAGQEGTSAKARKTRKQTSFSLNTEEFAQIPGPWWTPSQPNIKKKEPGKFRWQLAPTLEKFNVEPQGGVAGPQGFAWLAKLLLENADMTITDALPIVNAIREDALD